MVFFTILRAVTGLIMTQKIMLQRVINYDHEKEPVKRALNLNGKE